MKPVSFFWTCRDEELAAAEVASVPALFRQTVLEEVVMEAVSKSSEANGEQREDELG